MIGFLSLYYFTAVVDGGSITRVAEHEHISQQSLSAHIKKLEQQLGVTLLERQNGCRPTHAGERLYAYAVKILALRSQMLSELGDLKEDLQGSLHIGVTYTRGTQVLPELLPRYQKDNPFVHVSVIENNSHKLEEYLRRGHIDLYMGYIEPHNDPLVESIGLRSEKLYLVIPHEMYAAIFSDGAPESPVVSLRPFAACPFLLLIRGNTTREAVDRQLHREHLKVDIPIESDNVETLFELSCNGMGVSVFPEMYLKKYDSVLHSPHCPVKLLELDKRYYQSVLSVSFAKDRYLSRAGERFIELAKQIYSNTTE